MIAKVTVLPRAMAANRELATSAGPYIAIVDDDEPLCRAFARLVRAYSFQARTYGSGTDFLESLNYSVPDCLIVDIHLGDMTGFDVLRSLIDMGMNVPAIAMTARDEPGVRRDFMLCGASALLIKPVGIDPLLKAIESGMSTRRCRGIEG